MIGIAERSGTGSPGARNIVLSAPGCPVSVYRSGRGIIGTDASSLHSCRKAIFRFHKRRSGLRRRVSVPVRLRVYTVGG